MGSPPRKYTKAQRAEVMRLRTEEHKAPAEIARMMCMNPKTVYGMLYNDNPHAPTQVYRASGESKWDFTKENVQVND